VIFAVFGALARKKTRNPFVLAVKKSVLETELLTEERDFE